MKAQKKNPHMWLSRLGKPPRDHWKCKYCGEEGTMAQVRAVECRYEYPPCEHCGQTPECARDCPGVAAALSMPGVLVIGGE